MGTLAKIVPAKRADGAANARSAPIFITGFARSGTTWVNRLFREYFDAGFVNEGQFILSMGLRVARYGDLSRDRNRRRLVRDLRRDPFFVILSREYRVKIDWQRVAAASATFTAAVRDILRQIAEQTHKSRIGSKNPQFGRHLGWLCRTFPRCRVVHVVRDGRDCALSHRNLRWGRQNTYAAAALWRSYLRTAWASTRTLRDRYLEVRYEDLLTEPARTMSALEEFITGASGPVTDAYLRNAKLLRTDKVAGWWHAMTPAQRAIFEGVAGDALEQAGYPLTGAAHRPMALMRGVFAAHDKLTREGRYWTRKIAWHSSRRRS